MARRAYRSTEDVRSITSSQVARSVKGHMSATGQSYSHDSLVNSLGQFRAENGQSFAFSSLPNHLGGHRWLFSCPGCGRSCSKLFLPVGADSYKCSRCHGVKSPSALYGRSAVYTEVLRPVKEMARIMEKLRGGRLSEEEAQALVIRHEHLRQAVQSSPAYSRYLQKVSSARIHS